MSPEPRTLPGRCASLAVLGALAASSVRAQDAPPARTGLDLAPVVSRARPGVTSQLVPVRAGELVYVASALRLFALDAVTLVPRWEAGPPQGWSVLDEAYRTELLESIDHEFAWVAPAVGDEVAVAALQLPFTRQRRTDWQGLRILCALPERRLFAFARETGEPLWDHAPRATVGGHDVDPARCERVIGPPLVAGERVLAVWTSDASSIDYHLAAYELASGAAVWSTFVLRGQVRRNSLGNLVEEFLAPPLVLAPDRRHVLALTGLGTLALLDASTGELAWRTSYPAQLIPHSHSYSPPRRTLRWRSTAPIVVGETVLAAPPDSRALCAFDLVDGRLLWSLDSELGVPPCRPVTDHLAGVAGDTLYLAGPELAAVRCVGGLRAPRGFELAWTRPSGCTQGARARLAAGALFVPDAEGVRELDLDTGIVRHAHALDATLGLVVTDTELYGVGAEAVERRAR